jgi:hypothetical protein
MKKITLIFALLLAFSTIGYSQVSSYTFSQSNGTYTPIAGGTVLGNTTTDDQRFLDPAVPTGGSSFTGVGFPIGFDFTYNGVVYDRFAVNANGWISLGSSTLTPSVNMNTSSSYDPLSSTSTSVSSVLTARIAGYARDLNAQTGAELRFETTGSAPNRKLVVQWSNYRNYDATGNNLNFQIVLNETANSVDLIYGTMTVASSTTTMVGLRAEPNNAATNFNSRTSTTSWSTSAASTSATNKMTISATIFPASGLQYTWSPPSCGAPAGLTASSVTTSTATISWNAAVPVPATGYEYFYSDTNTPPAAAGTATANLSEGLTGLNANTTYYLWVRSDCGSGTFSPWSGPINFTTLCDSYNTFPFTETFEVASSSRSCWLNVQEVGTSNWTFATGSSGGAVSSAFEGTLNARFVSDLGTNSPITKLVSPVFDMSTLTNPRLKFHYAQESWSGDQNELKVYYRISSSDPWIEIGHYTSNVAAWTEVILTLPSPSASYQIAFEGINNFGRANVVDNVIVEQTPPCINPLSLSVNSITTNSVNFLFNSNPDGSQLDFAYVVQPQGTDAPTTYPAGTAEDGSNSANGINYVIPVTGLNSNTAYEIYVAADCNGTWVGPVNFRTLCESITVLPHAEGFDAAATPSCWSTALIAGTTNWAPDDASDGVPSARTGARFAGKSWLGNDDALLISPPYDLSAYPTDQVRLNVWIYRSTDGLSTDRVTFYANTTNNLTGATMLVDVPLPITSAPTVASAGWYNYTVDVPLSYNTGGIFYIIAQGRTSSSWSSYSVGFDDYVLELTPTAPPSCATNIVATPDVNCGNFANSITWDATDGAEGYTINVGTTTGGTDIANAVSLTSATYSFTGTMNTTYYYTITPFNANGTATGCSEQSFTTNANGCYCTSMPTSNDGNGISNVQIGTTNFPTSDVFYFDHSATTVDLATTITSNVQITFETGTTYNTYIWIDFNDNYSLETSELVYQGESLSADPTTLNASFIIPNTATLGLHRMRIVTSDFAQNPPNPCYSDSWGVTLDFTINVVAATCSPAVVASSTIVPDCVNGQFSVDIDVTALGDGTPVVSDGTTTWPVAATGIVTVGPFADGATVSLSVLHGVDNTCDLPLGNFSNTCPPTNDTCATAIAVDCTDVVTGSTATGATDTGNNASADVWYSYSGAAGDITASLCTNTNFDTFIRVFDTCGGTQIASNDDSCGTQSSVTFTANGTSTYYIMVEGYGTATGSFELTIACVLNADSFDNNNFMAYPNPVKDVLNLSYTSDISTVTVMNMLGQEVISRNLNATPAQVDMSQLSAGAYIVNVTIGDTVKTIKVVKQ